MYNPWLLLVHKDQQRLVKFTTSSNLISDALNSKSLMTVLWFSWLLVQSLTICTMDLLWKRHHLIRFLTKVHISTSKMLQEHTHTHSFYYIDSPFKKQTHFFHQIFQDVQTKTLCFARVSHFTEVTGKTTGRGAPNFHCFWGEKHQRMRGFGVSLPGQLRIYLKGWGRNIHMG